MPAPGAGLGSEPDPPFASEPGGPHGAHGSAGSRRCARSTNCSVLPVRSRAR